MSGYKKLIAALKRFGADRRGAFAISFVMLSTLLMSLAAFGLEGSRYITERARLSDAMEQAALALTAEDNGAGAARNYTLASDYFRAWMRNEKRVITPKITVNSGVVANNSLLTYVEYRVSGHTVHDSWFSSSLFPSFDKEVAIGENGAARKLRSNMDVMFVVDFSGSMNFQLGYQTKLVELKRIVLKLSEELFAYNIGNKVGFVPFGWGSKSGNMCDFPFVANRPVPVNLLTQPARVFEQYVDIAATIAAIPKKINQFAIPLSYVKKDYCLRESYSWAVPLTSSMAQIRQIQGMTADGGTLVSSGVLLGVPYLTAGTAPRKIMIIISDGIDDPAGISITPRLIEAGMCDKIRDVLSTKEAVGKISFIGINYAPTYNWRRCVGEKNFYLPRNIYELERDLQRAVFEEVGHNVVKD
ncbi:TadE/TadG family type IV pilus assembly protein [Mixta theicola]|uniref:TadE/TadG family type IV pilus assembly protein n=1 Tax=Mixta theicola TaxID=1458355 RepID=UPI00235C0BF2|nr:TadE/TadG family type IV pilus assembly protein [Mixta theicola]GLR07775.1 tight adherance operon protein [Mixta theicola]